MAFYGATAGAAAAERHRQMLSKEEEGDMTQYTHDDLKSNWEFKIVRSDTAAFRKPEILSQLIEEESRAAWVMLEKFDDSRVRFKRPRTARARDAFLPDDVDPYRTRYGGYGAQRAVILGLVLGVMFLLLGAAVFGYVLSAR
ncbi:MAG: hypothetical protein GY832_18245 [Chloroflexi bacterium]|nr:hypothetical protein [Chloroflexota bacterium]